MLRVFCARGLLLLALPLSTAACAILEGDPYQLENVTMGAPLERAFAVDRETPPLTGVAVDAKQRFVWSPRMSVRTIKEHDGKFAAGYEKRAILCAEPSPDALTAIANSIDTELRRGGTEEVAASFAGSLSEAVQTIGNRTQVIQLLRDALYRACEAYANGAFDDFGYSVILGHIDLFMLQLLSADILGRARGRADVAEKTAARDEANKEVQRLRSELARKIQDLARLHKQAQTVQDRTAQISSLQAHKDLLEATKTTLTGERSKLEGPAAEQGSLAHTRSQLAGIEEARRTADKKKAEYDQNPNDDDAKKAYEEADSEARIAEAGRKYFADKLARDEAYLQTVNLKLVSLDRDIATVAGDLAQAQSSPATAAPDKDRVTAAQNDVDNIRTALATAQSGLATAAAALARASEGTGPGPAEVQALTALVEKSFTAADGEGPPGRATKIACLQWFARNPQIKMKPGTADKERPAFQDDKDIPGIAVYCQRILRWSAKPDQKTTEGAIRQSGES